ncbi:MAG TPA: flagellar export chaperone FliS [Terriglobales bacterium]|nr:flagellar export chaperone FliS [Terriglobales bacterium]
MTRNQTELTYLRAEVRNASPARLVIVLYDLLIGALTDAIDALDRNDVEERSRNLKRAFLVLEQMEASLDMSSGGDAARNLARFYAVLRSNIMAAHAQGSRALLEKQIQLLFQVREAWAKVDKPNSISSTQQENGAELAHSAASWSA